MAAESATVTSGVPGWWLALPLLLLPIWWHRRKQQRLRSQPLATARFLPAAAPRQQRIWRWADKGLLLLRCLLLLTLIAWLADVSVAWRGDTVWLGPQLDAQAVDVQLQQAGMAQAQRRRFCAEASAAPDCNLHTDDILAWLTAHQREWRADARWLLIANAAADVGGGGSAGASSGLNAATHPGMHPGRKADPMASDLARANASGTDLPMPASPPALTRQLDMRVLAASASASAASAAPTAAAVTTERHVVLVSNRSDRWRALFTAFQAAGLGNDRYVFSPEPDAQTELIVWDKPQAPDARWRAPLWWLGDAAVLADLAPGARWQHLPVLPGLQTADTPRGQVWSLPRWPLHDVDAARTLYQTWAALQRAPLPYAPPSQVLAAQAGATSATPAGALQAVLAPLLAALFALERLLAHARRG